MKHKIGFIGLGLIGGSIAKAIRQYYPDYEIVAFDKNKESLALATQESMIDVAATTIDNNFQNCNYIFLCAPVAYNTAYLKQLTEYLNDDCILTDVGSVKTNIHEEVQNLGIGKYFIGGHPMAGSEKSGYSNSKAMLIENAYYILTAAGRAAAPVHRPDRGNGSADVYSHHCTPQLSAGSGIDDAVHLCGVLCHAAACAAYQHGGKHESPGVSLQNLHKKNMVSQKFFGMIMLPTGGAATA